MSLDVLTDPPDIVEAAKRAAQVPHAAGSAEHTLVLPHAIAARAGPTVDLNTLSLPIDHRLEALARSLISSPADFNHGVDPNDRALADGPYTVSFEYAFDPAVESFIDYPDGIWKGRTRSHEIELVLNRSL